MVSERSENQLKLVLQNSLDMPFCQLTRSGSTAIILAMQAYNVAVGRQVIIPASCCPIVMYSLQMAGYEVVLADVSLETLNCDLEHIKAVVTENTGAILAVHAYGRVCDINNILAFAQMMNIVVIEDACLAYGGEYKGRSIGSFADASVVSFGYDKPIAYGMGGALLLKDEYIAKRANNILRKNAFFCMPGSDEMRVELAKSVSTLSEVTERRKGNVQYIHGSIKNPIFRKLSMPYFINYWRYPLLISQELRSQFLAFAKQHEQVFTCHFQSLGAMFTYSNVPNADLIGASIINLFVKPSITQNQLDNMINVVNEFDYDT